MLAKLLSKIKFRLIGFGKNVAKKHPPVRQLLLRLHKGVLVNKVQRRVQGRNNLIFWNDAILDNVKVKIEGSGNRISIKKGCYLKKVLFYIRGDNNTIEIGNSCYFNRGGELWIEDTGNCIKIGNGSSFENVHLAATEGRFIKIGDDCMFAYEIEIRTGDSHSIIDAETGIRLNPAKDVQVDEHVWVGAHVTILKGVHIGNHAVIGSGTLVTKTVEPGTIVAGNPARILRSKISWKRERV